MKKYSIVLLLIASSVFAGTPDQDGKVKQLRTMFENSLSTFPSNGFDFNSNWNCRSYDAFKDDFYSEPDMTFRFSKEWWEDQTLTNKGGIIFKELQFTARGIQSVKHNAAYCSKPVHLTLRPFFRYSAGTAQQQQQQQQRQAVSEMHLIGEIAVEPSSLHGMGIYYGYGKAFSGVPSVVDPSKTVYYYLMCNKVDEPTARGAEARNRTWSIPAELSRHWPNCQHCH